MSSQPLPGAPPPAPPRRRIPSWAWIVGALMLVGATVLVTILVTDDGDERAGGPAESTSPSLSPSVSGAASRSATPSGSPSEAANPEFDALVAQLPPEASGCISIPPNGIFGQASARAKP